MGYKVAPVFANLVLPAWEINTPLHLQGFKHTRLYKRYIDGIFFVWQGGEQLLLEFIDSHFY